MNYYYNQPRENQSTFCILCRELGTLVLVSSGATLDLAVEQRLAILVEPELGDGHLGGVDADIDC
jgi:hypothetical protein